VSDSADCATLDGVTQPRPGHQSDPLQLAFRDVLTLTSLARTVLARRLGLSVHDVEAMEQVMVAGEPLGPVELSRRLGVTSAAATQAVHRLQAAGHVVRAPHPADRRRKVLSVTPSGAAHVFSELGPLLALSARAFEDMSEEERATVQRFLDGIADAYREFIGGPASPEAAREQAHLPVG
jgi:DNA-binding MarR family transcriptional regulator